MATSDALRQARAAKKDEFYTQYVDIQKEVNAYLEYNPEVFRGKTILLPCDDPEWSNFTRFFAENFELYGLKKLISTSFAVESKQIKWNEPTLFETEAPNYDEAKTRSHGKIFVLDRDINNSGRIDIDDLQWEYLEGTGDFRSKEVTALRDEADIIITNPPFSLFREFISWIFEANKQFLVLGNINNACYKEVFPLMQNNKMWLGLSISSGDREFRVPDEYPLEAAGWRIDDGGIHYIKVKGVRWFTNLEHGRHHEPYKLMTEAENIKYSKHKEVKGIGYSHYENYDAIDIPYTDAIPSDYDGIMGVPVTFLDKYCPEQFEIVGLGSGYLGQSIGIKGIPAEHKQKMPGHSAAGDLYMMIEGMPKVPYSRILIRKKQ